MLIIGLGHKARQGKDTAATELATLFPPELDVRRVAFADALRAEVGEAIRRAGGAAALVGALQAFGNAPDWLRAEPAGQKQRTLLQWWGTDLRRSADPDYWVRRFSGRLDASYADVSIVTDLRFPNEADFIRSQGGVLVKVTRTTPPDVNVPEHESERALDGYTHWDYHLEAATVDELQAKVRELYAEIASKR